MPTQHNLVTIPLLKPTFRTRNTSVQLFPSLHFLFPLPTTIIYSTQQMSTTRYISGHDPFKSLKTLPLEKTNNRLKTTLKAILPILLILSIPVILYSIFYPDKTNPPAFFQWPSYQTLTQTRYQTQLFSDPTPTNISHLAFGIGGSAWTWSKRGHYSDSWFKPGYTRGFVFIDKPGPVTRFKIPHRFSSPWTGFKGLGVSVRIARVVKDLFRVGLPNVRWFVMGDDDTVFFPENLVTVLGKYDHREMVYVGGNSESVAQDERHAYDMAFGGGGYAVSYALAVEVVRVLDGCLHRYHYMYGSDERIWACVGELGVSLTRELGFHQFDIRGDPYGLLAAHPLAPLISLHHLDFVKPLFPNKTQLDSVTTLMKAYELDPSRILQQCYCYHHKHKWSVSISWGYTVQIYPTLMTARDLGISLLTFKTWQEDDGPFTFNTRPLSPNPCERPIIFYLDSVHEGIVNETTTTYMKLVVDPTIAKNCNRYHVRALALESIVVKAPKMDPREWQKQKVPRRHCCDLRRGLTHNTMRIQIRKCKQSETITM